MIARGNQRLLKNRRLALLLGLIALVAVLVVVVDFWPEWDLLPLDKVPFLFWVLYVPAALGWFDAIIYGVMTPGTVPVKKPFISDIFITDVMVAGLGAFFVGRNPQFAWTSGRLLMTTAVVLLLLQGGYYLSRGYREKRRVEGR